ncbi:histidine--tRNA ligase, cytoplasmic-like isoform X2 [Lethenteron reissneri]|uniref:histidine--tRNA ligase, cytoplasmic-like isoform X2 n=1 Tax=Lethenteron reissneri TaxID=7753 RepID=UPI002AB783FF|nr:histidine--tRNA ligase, cytoplasmic-like isoform X2 [Lethenteron reissneri]
MVRSGLWTTLWGRRLSLRLVSSPRASTSLSTSSSSTHSTYSTSSSTSNPTQPGHELGSSAQEKQRRQAVLKTPKGMRDSDPHRMSLVSHVLDTAISCFRRHGAQAMDTPLLERKDILVGHYGEEARLIYELQDQGGEHLALRYDLTVPFARYLASGRVSRMKRYQVGRVYRRDNPSLAQGRLREFWQTLTLLATTRRWFQTRSASESSTSCSQT